MVVCQKLPLAPLYLDLDNNCQSPDGYFGNGFLRFRDSAGWSFGARALTQTFTFSFKFSIVLPTHPI